MTKCVVALLRKLLIYDPNRNSNIHEPRHLPPLTVEDVTVDVFVVAADAAEVAAAAAFAWRFIAAATIFSRSARLDAASAAADAASSVGAGAAEELSPVNDDQPVFLSPAPAPAALPLDDVPLLPADDTDDAMETMEAARACRLLGGTVSTPLLAGTTWNPEFPLPSPSWPCLPSASTGAVEPIESGIKHAK